MSDFTIRKTYHYSAHGHALSGQFERPLQKLIEVQAAASLPTIGGHGNSRVEKYKFEEFLSFEAAYSHVSGSKKKEDGTHTTLVTTAIEGLNILDVVTADRIVTRLSAQHPKEPGEAAILLLGSKFENLKIAGCPVHVDLNHDFFYKLGTFSAIREELEKNAEFRKMALDPFETGETRKVPDSHGTLLCSLVKSMKVDCPGVTRRGHAFIVPQFGKVFLGEILATHGARTLSMLRLELGSPVTADVSTTEGYVNGSTWP
jgi:hypothetical protein